MIVTIVLVIVNVITRKLFNYIIIWSEEVATSCFVYSVFIGAAYAYRKHQHVGVDLLVERLPAGARRAVHLITSALLVVINGYITMRAVYPVVLDQAHADHEAAVQRGQHGAGHRLRPDDDLLARHFHQRHQRRQQT